MKSADKTFSTAKTIKHLKFRSKAAKNHTARAAIRRPRGTAKRAAARRKRFGHRPP
jgi:hypothetical protein